MGRSFVQSLRTELESKNLIALGIVLIALYALIDTTWTTLAGILIAVAGLAVLEAGLSSVDAPQYVSGIILGGVVATVAGTVAVLESSWLLAAIAIVGGWLCLDSRYDRRHGIDRSEPIEDPLDGLTFRESMQSMSDAREIVETLRESPVALTPAQVADRTAFSSDEVEHLLETLDDGPIEQVDDRRYTVDESEMGASSAARDAIRRLVRPFTVLTGR